MAARSPANVRAPRLNPFAFASDTSFRFALLIGMVVAANVYLSLQDHLRSEERSDLTKCIEEAKKANQPKLNIKNPGALRNDPSIRVQCSAQFESSNIHLWAMAIANVGSMLFLASVIYWFFPAWKIRRDGLVFVDDTPELEDCGLVGYLEFLRLEALVANPVFFLLDPRNKGSDAQAFGRLGTYYISLPHGLVTLFLQGDFHKFRAIVLHELAHLRNADVDKTYFSVALWWAFVLSLPLISFNFFSLGFLTFTACVYLIRNAILRAREFYADVQVSVWEWDGLHRLLKEARSPSKGRYHPTPAERLRVLHDPSLLFRLGSWDAVGVGVATAFGLFNVMIWLKSQPFPDMGWFLGPPLIFMSLATGAVGLGVWRGTFATLMRGETPREAWRLGLGLTSGFVVGKILSFGFTFGISMPGDLDRMLFPLSDLLWTTLLAGILVLIFKWVELAAATWIPVSLRSRSPRWAYRIGLILVSGSLGFWLGALLYLADLFNKGWWPLFPDIEQSIALVDLLAIGLNIPGLLSLMCLWIFPLAAWFWRGRAASAPISNWPFLEAPPLQLTSPPPVLLRPALALTLGLAGGLIFVVLSPFDIYVPLELVEVAFDLEAPILAQIAAAALIQMGVAALVAGCIKRLGVLHALFAAFIAGCVMAGAIWDLHSSGNVLLIFALVIYPGTLLALPTAFGVSVAANWIRRSLRSSHPTAGHTIAPKKGKMVWPEAEQKKALRTAQQMAALFVTVGVVVAIIQVISNRLTEKEAVREFVHTARELISAKIARIENDDNDTKTTYEHQEASNTPGPLDWKPELEQQQKASRPAGNRKGFFQRLNEISKEFQEKALMEQKQSDAEFDLIGVETMFLPEILTTKIGIEDNQRKLKRLSDWTERWDMIDRARMKEWEERIGSIALGSKYAKGLVDEMAKKIRDQKLLARQADACWEAALAAITKVNHFMAARLGKVVVQDGQLVFNTQDEIDTFNEYMDEINKQEQLAADLQQRYLQWLQQELMNISELAR